MFLKNQDDEDAEQYIDGNYFLYSLPNKPLTIQQFKEKDKPFRSPYKLKDILVTFPEYETKMSNLLSYNDLKKINTKIKFI